MKNQINFRAVGGLAFVVIEAFLAGCGGGGAASTTNTGSNTSETLAVSPSALSLLGSSSSGYISISGGTAPYAVFTSNALVQPQAVSSGKSYLTIGCTDSSATATITVVDSKGASATATITVSDNDAITSCSSGVSPLSVSPPASTVLSQASSFALTVSGGTAPYSMYSNNALVTAGAVTSGKSTLSIGCTDTQQTAVVTVVDSKGSSATSSITVSDDSTKTCSAGSASVAISPSSLTLVGLTAGAKLTVSGGTEPYDVYTSNSLVVPAGVSSGKSNLTIGCTDTSQSALITVVDSNGQSATASVLVTDNSPSSPCLIPETPLTISPLNLNVLGKEVGAYLTISGGTGPYNILSNNSLVVPSVISSGKSTLTIGCTDSATPISAIVTVLDSKGAAATSTVVVADDNENVSCAGNSSLAMNPPALSVKGGDTAELVITGGTGSYSIYSDNSVVTLGILVAGKSALTMTCTDSTQTANVTVVDSSGTSDVTTITVADADPNNICAPSSSPLTVTPSGIAGVPIGQPVRMMIYGGVPPYIINSTNTAVGTVTGSVASSGGFVTFTPVTQGSVSLVVEDAAHTVRTIAMTTTQPGGSVLNVLPTSVSWSGTCDGSVAYTDFVVSGGIAPYTAFTTAGSIAVVAGPFINADGYRYFRVSEACQPSAASAATGNADIVIRDAVGAQISATFKYF